MDNLDWESFLDIPDPTPSPYHGHDPVNRFYQPQAAVKAPVKVPGETETDRQGGEIRLALLEKKLEQRELDLQQRELDLRKRELGLEVRQLEYQQGLQQKYNEQEDQVSPSQPEDSGACNSLSFVQPSSVSQGTAAEGASQTTWEGEQILFDSTWPQLPDAATPFSPFPDGSLDFPPRDIPAGTIHLLPLDVISDQFAELPTEASPPINVAGPDAANLDAAKNPQLAEDITNSEGMDLGNQVASDASAVHPSLLKEHNTSLVGSRDPDCQGLSHRRKRRPSIPPIPGVICFEIRPRATSYRNSQRLRTKEEMENTALMRKIGACLRCKIRKIKCSGDTPCTACLEAARVLSEKETLRTLCVRLSLMEWNIFDYDLSFREAYGPEKFSAVAIALTLAEARASATRPSHRPAYNLQPFRDAQLSCQPGYASELSGRVTSGMATHILHMLEKSFSPRHLSSLSREHLYPVGHGSY